MGLHASSDLLSRGGWCIYMGRGYTAGRGERSAVQRKRGAIPPHYLRAELPEPWTRVCAQCSHCQSIDDNAPGGECIGPGLAPIKIITTQRGLILKLEIVEEKMCPLWCAELFWEEPLLWAALRRGQKHGVVAGQKHWSGRGVGGLHGHHHLCGKEAVNALDHLHALLLLLDSSLN